VSPLISDSEPGTRNSKLKIILIMSSPEELRPFLRRVQHRRTIFQGKKAWDFQGPRYAGLALLAGMGSAKPRLLAEQAIAACSPDWLLVAGFGGALTALPPPGGILIATECWRLTPAGPLSRVEFQPPAPPVALTSLLQTAGLPVSAGALLTTPGLMAKASVPSQVFRLPHPVMDLETAQIAAVAQTHGLPLLAVRAITDGAGEEIQGFLADLINQHQGVPLFYLLPALCADPRRVGYCIHLWRRSRLAGANLARALHLILDHLTHPAADSKG
jgi:adenosylhomocysteine nucleosidase